MDHDQADVTVPTLAEMERCATILSTRMASQHRTAGEIMNQAPIERLQMGAATSQLGASLMGAVSGDMTRTNSATMLGSIVPTSPHDARLASLEAEVARLMAANAVLQRGMQIIAAADVLEPAKAGIPARALGCHAQRIGLLTGIW